MKIAPRAPLSKELVDEIKSIYAARLEQYRKNMNDFYSPHQKNVYFEKNKVNIQKLVKLLSDPDVLDFELTRLRSLSYSAFEIRANSNNEKYFCGLTFPVKLLWIGRGYGKVKMDMGEYRVCISLSYLKTGKSASDTFHFYPIREPLTHDRHPHHTASLDYRRSEPSDNPLDMRASTCLGGFNSIVYSSLNSGDIVETMRSLYLYLNTVNTHSLLNGTPPRHYSYAVIS